MSNMVLRGANELPWPRGFQIGVTLDAFLKFLKSGAGRGHCVGPLKGGQGGPLRKVVNQIFLPLYYTRVFISRRDISKNRLDKEKWSKINVFKPHLDAISDLQYVRPGYSEPYANMYWREAI